MERRGYDGLTAYKQSKQAIRMLTWSMAKRFAELGATANVADPGLVKTSLNRDASGMFALISNLSVKLFGDSREKAADTASWLAYSPEVAATTGELFKKRKIVEGGFRDPDHLEALWALCAKMTGLDPSAPLTVGSAPAA